MSYEKQAKNINKEFTHNLFGMSDERAKKLIEATLYFGQVAKFRCKNNKAYDNFAKLCFKGLAELSRTKPEHLDFEILLVKKVLHHRAVEIFKYFYASAVDELGEDLGGHSIVDLMADNFPAMSLETIRLILTEAGLLGK